MFFFAVHFFFCETGDLQIPTSFRCDGERDCPDNSDESGCGQYMYDVLFYALTTRTNICTITKHSVCFVRTNYILRSLLSVWLSDFVHLCDSRNRIINTFQLCDGFRDCEDGSDEQGCCRFCSWQLVECLKHDCSMYMSMHKLYVHLRVQSWRLYTLQLLKAKLKQD